MTFVNLTPDVVTIFMGDNSLTVTSAGNARIAAQYEVESQIQVYGLDADAVIPITKTVFVEPVGLPEPEKGVSFIVSRLVAAALPQRDDLFFPNQLVRDEEGRIIGCKSLGRI